MVNCFEMSTLSSECWRWCLKDDLNFGLCPSNGRLKVPGEQNRVTVKKKKLNKKPHTYIHTHTQHAHSYVILKVAYCKFHLTHHNTLSLCLNFVLHVLEEFSAAVFFYLNMRTFFFWSSKTSFSLTSLAHSTDRKHNVNWRMNHK